MKIQTVSIVVICHEYGRYLRNCLESIENQTRKADEVIVVIDSCTDNSPQIAQTMGGVKIVHVNCANSSMSRRAGYLKAKCEGVIFVDADDELDSSFLELIIKCQHQNQQSIISGIAMLTGPYGGGHWVPSNPNNLIISSLIPRRLLTDTKVFDQPSVLSENFENVEMWRILTQNSADPVICNEAILFYRQHDKNKTLSSPNINSTNVSDSLIIRNAPDYEHQKQTKVAWVAGHSELSGGIRTHIEAMYAYSKKIKYEIIIPCDDWEIKTKRISDIPIRWVEKSKLVEILNYDFDYAYFNGSPVGLLDPKSLSCKIVIVMHTMSEIDEEWENQANFIVATCRANENLVSSQNRLRTRHIPIGFDPRQIRSKKNKTEIRESLNLKGKWVIGWVGRTSSRKNIKQLAEYLGKQTNPRIVGLFAGIGYHPLSSVVEEINEISKGRVSWLNRFTPGEVYTASNILVIPSSRETGPLVSLEGIASGVPVVSQNVGTMRDLASDFPEVYTCLDGLSVEDFDKAVIEALKTPQCQIDRRRSIVFNNYSAFRTALEFDRMLDLS